MQEFILLTFAGGIITRTAEMLLESSARAVKRRFEKSERRQALETALDEGLSSALALLKITDETEKQHYQGIFEAFLERTDVIDEFAQLLDPRPDTTLNLELLENEFRAAGFEPEALPEFSFENFVRRFIGAFYDSAARQPSFQAAVQIGLLRGMVERMDALQQSSARTAEATEHIANGVDEIEQMLASFLDKQDKSNNLLSAIENVLQEGQLIPQHQFLEKLTSVLNKKGFDIEIGGSTGSVIIGNNNVLTEGLDNTSIQKLAEEMSQLRQAIQGSQPTEEELNALEKRYRQHIIHWFNRLTFAGMMRTAKPISLPLEEVYVELRAVAEVPEAADTFSVEERRLLLEKEDVDEESRRDLLRELDTLRRERWSRSIPERKSIAETLYSSEQRAFVILGDPGSGKSTLLHFLALVHARGPQAAIEKLQAPSHEADRLPIFVPLAAFDDMASREPGLSMLEFLSIYYDQRRMLPGLKPLFERALESGRAIIFFDGLDEVLDSTRRAYVSQQVNAMIGEWGSRGVRFAVTSRFVGYREAPLAGNLPHLSVVDFGFDEIRTFVHQWSLAYERFAAGSDIETPEVTRKAREMERNLLDDVASNASVRRLAANPLMLTMLALLRRQVGKLPHRRILLYNRYISTLIENWVEARSEGARETSLQTLDLPQIESILMPLALWLQQNKPSGTASKAEIREELAHIYLLENGIHEKATAPQKREAHAQADHFLREIREMTGLIVERGQDAFGFLHLTFQEYFAGRALAAMSDDERWQMLLPYLHAPRWREPLLLCAGQLGVVENRRKQVSALARQILNCNDETEQDLRRNLLLVLAIAGDDVNLEPELINQLIQQAETCLPTRVYSLANLVIKGLGQIIANGIEGPASLVMKTLDDPDWQLRQTAIEALAGFAPTSMTLRNALQAKLDDRNWDVRRAAVSALAPLASTQPDILNALQAKLDDEVSDVRSAAVRALAPHASTHPSILTALQAKLDDYDNYVRSATVSALAPLVSTRPDILTALQAKLDDDGGLICSVAISALAPLASTHPDILAALQAKLDDETHYIRSAAVNALAPLARTHPDILNSLQIKLDDEFFDVRRAVVSALAPLASTHPNILNALQIKLDDDDFDVRSEVASVLAPYPESHNDIKNILIEGQKSEAWEVRQSTLEMAGKILSLQEQSQLIYLTMQQEQAVESWRVRSAAVSALAPLASTHPDILTALQAKLDDKVFHVCSAAVSALAPLASTNPEILTLLQAKLDDKSFYIRSAAVSALAPLASTHPNILTALQAKLDDGNYNIRSAAITALASLASTQPDILNALQVKLDDEVSDVRSTAVSALAPLASTRSDILKALQMKFDNDDNGYGVRPAIITALAPLASTHPDILTALQNKLNDSNYDVRSAAVSALALLASTQPEILNAIQAKLDNEEFLVRSAAIRALAPLANTYPNIFNTLRDMLNDDDFDIQSTAISALAPFASTHANILDALQNKIYDSNYGVRRAVIGALAPLANAHNGLIDILLDWLQVDEDEYYIYNTATQKLINQITTCLEDRLEEILHRLLGWLDSPRCSSRAGAISALAYHYREKGLPPDVLAKVLKAMEDRRGLESYPARLSAAALLINRDEHCPEAIQLCLEALEYGTQPWEYLPFSGEIREQAALVLGKLEPLRFDARVYEKLLFVMQNDQNPTVRDSAYAALTRLARAREEQGLACNKT